MDIKTLSPQAQALIKRLSRYQLIDKDDGSVVLGAWGRPGDEFTEQDRAVLLEIKQVLIAERDAERQAAAERQARIDAIPGLQAIRDAADEWEAYRMAFNAMMEDEDNDGARPPKLPTSDVKALMQAYPVAAAYLKAEAYSHAANAAKAAAGRKAVEAIINGEDAEAAIAAMEESWSNYCSERIWD